MHVLHRAALGAVLFGVTLIGGQTAHAQFNPIASPSGLNSSDITLTYSGPSGSQPSPLTLSNINSTNMATLTDSGTFFIQPGSSFGFSGNQTVFETFNSASRTAQGPLTITFASGVSEFGLFAEDASANSGNFTFTVFNSVGQSQQFTQAFTVNPNNPSPTFLGASTSTSSLITRLLINSPSQDFVTGPVTISDPSATPEPSQLAAFSIGILGLAGLSLRARRRRPQLTA